ncbi:MAG TPA: dienelactone hydrolase family protein [Dehalococcoidia bacterium]|nr:dienelactone hydrolase family protein [Dehalococcoidia bacterium]
MGTMVTFASNGGQAEGYLATPTAANGGGIIVIQEWWGLVDHIKNIAERFASEGFVALAPDLYHGRQTTEPDEAQKLAMSLQMDQAAKDMSGAVDYLRGRPEVTGGIGVVGFCLGGGLALYLASIRPEIAACVPYYGALMGATPDLSAVRAAVLGHYADHDDFASPEVARGLEEQLRSHGREATFHIYPNTQHAFFNDTRPETYNADAARQSWERTLEFFRSHLK